MSKANTKVTYLELDVDELGRLLAQKAQLEEQINAIKASLTANGDGAYEGRLFRATVSTSERKSVDYKAIAAKLGASPQMIRGNTSVNDVVAVRCTARKGVK